MIPAIFQQRLHHLLDVMEREEDRVADIILKERKMPKLDPVKKKRLDYPVVLFPAEKVPLEWWYFTGHLRSGKKQFGFEYCFFKFHPQSLRMGFLPLSLMRKKPFLVYHGSITDKTKKTFVAFQDSGLITKDNIAYDGVNVSLGKASLLLENGAFKLRSQTVSLIAKPVKPLIKHFDEGFALISKHPIQRTYYVTFPRLSVKGTLTSASKTYVVKGEAWFDHQKSNLPRRPRVIGWDWFSIIFDDNTELMFFVLRDEHGTVRSYLGGTYIQKDASTLRLYPEEVTITLLHFWKSSKTGIIYPSGWRLQSQRIKLNITVQPCVQDQEIDALLTTPTSYWEGACTVQGTKAGKAIKGNAYVELVGYDKRLIANVIKKSML
ncbi:MAG: lipocalin family protein [archaeon]